MDASLVAPQLAPVAPCSWSLKTTCVWCSLRIMGCLIFTLCSVASSRIIPGSNGSSAIHICGGCSFSSSLRSLSSDVAFQFWGVRPGSIELSLSSVGAVVVGMLGVVAVVVSKVFLSSTCVLSLVFLVVSASGGTYFGFSPSRGGGYVVETLLRVRDGLHHPSHLADRLFFFFFGHAVMESVWKVGFDEVDLLFVVCCGKC
jgi:hypothetical protein